MVAVDECLAESVRRGNGKETGGHRLQAQEHDGSRSKGDTFLQGTSIFERSFNQALPLKSCHL